MLLYFLYVLLLPGNDAIGQSHYECGEHGRFEYCIDDIPSCVVGCHCHPGYYFDTETKICEPNSKLVQEYRRVFGDMSSARTHKFPYGYPEGNHTIDGLELQVENITNNQTDELGDWLYNQFFKAIESQALNNSIDTVTEKSPSRRSGSGSAKDKNKDGKTDKKKSKRKARSKKKLERKLVKRLKKKKDDPRRRLLRISEDDSLFETSDSHGHDDDDSDSGSSDSSDTESSETESSSGSSSSEETDKDNKQDKHSDHGHESVLYFNKKNKPPLPSFIFLPQSVNTPYFPPIGLPALAPPPIPLYPMIPVPPLMPFSDCNITNTSAPTTTTTTSTSTSTTTTTTEATTTTTTPKAFLRQPMPMPLPPIPPPMVPPVKKNFKWSKRRRKPMVRPRIPPMSAAIAPQKMKPSPPPTIPEPVPTMPETIPTIPETVPPIPEAMPPLPSYEPPPVEDVPIPYPEFPVQPMPVVRAHVSPEPENVDFKYLAQLIHKMDNNSNNTNIINFPTSDDKKKERNMPAPVIQLSKDSRRIMNSDLQRNLNARTEDENYYSKLGHEIAALIRQIDTTGGRRVNIEIERRIRDQELPAQPVFNEYSYSPRSYWDRSVRSLLKHFPTYTDEIFPRKVQEDSLFNLENKVETVATTMSSLSLSDIENVIFLIDKTKAQLSMKMNNTNHQNVDYKTGNLNINLLPHPQLHPRSSEKRVRNVYFQNSTIYVNGLNKISNLEPKHNNTTNNRQKYNREKDINDLRGIFLRNIKKLRPDIMEPYNYDSRITNNSVLISENENEIAHFQRIAGVQLEEAAKGRRQQLPRTPWLAASLADMIKAHKDHDIQREHLPHISVAKYIPTPYNIKLHITPTDINFPKLSTLYGDKINRHYHHKGMQIPLYTSLKRKNLGANSVSPTYFLHKFEHFDIFD